MTKALFLDRDGVINVEKDYLYKKEDFEFIDGIIDLCKYYISNGYIICIITNQSGIARGYYTENDFLNLTAWMCNEFKSRDIKINKVYYCPHHPSITGECSCRKPNSGMLLQAQNDFDIDLSKSIIIGDKERDIQAGLNIGVMKSYLFDENSIFKTSNATKIVSHLDEIWK